MKTVLEQLAKYVCCLPRARDHAKQIFFIATFSYAEYWFVFLCPKQFLVPHKWCQVWTSHQSAGECLVHPVFTQFCFILRNPLHVEFSLTSTAGYFTLSCYFTFQESFLRFLYSFLHIWNIERGIWSFNQRQECEKPRKILHLNRLSFLQRGIQLHRPFEFFSRKFFGPVGIPSVSKNILGAAWICRKFV